MKPHLFRTLGLLTLLLPLFACAQSLSPTDQQITAAGRTFTVQVIRVPLSEYRVKVGLAQGRVGAVQSLAGIAGREGAVAAINGCFFNAYTKAAIKPPYHNLVTNGEVVHLGDTGTTLGFDAAGNYRMESVHYTLQGRTGGNDWYAYFMNHPAETRDAAVIYTSYWTGGQAPSRGRKVVVENGKVTALAKCGCALPAKGYVLLFCGGEEYLAKRFRTGAACRFRLAVERGDAAFWKNVQEALGCGPRLVKADDIALNPRAEGFTEAKILSMACRRSAVGITRNGDLLLVTCPSATMRQLAAIMRNLGAYDAMNLDGGASSGLWCQDHYLTTPGREISNALLIVKR